LEEFQSQYLEGLGEVSQFLAQRLFLHDATIDNIGMRDEDGNCLVSISAPYKFMDGRFVELQEHLELKLSGCVLLQSSINDDPAGYDVLSLRLSENRMEIRTIVGEMGFKFGEIGLVVNTTTPPHVTK